jgi:hypothetical protein
VRRTTGKKAPSEQRSKPTSERAVDAGLRVRDVAEYMEEPPQDEAPPQQDLRKPKRSKTQ